MILFLALVALDRFTFILNEKSPKECDYPLGRADLESVLADP
jgi:hypothetical protein